MELSDVDLEITVINVVKECERKFQQRTGIIKTNKMGVLELKNTTMGRTQYIGLTADQTQLNRESLYWSYLGSVQKDRDQRMETWRRAEEAQGETGEMTALTVETGYHHGKKTQVVLYKIVNSSRLQI